MNDALTHRNVMAAFQTATNMLHDRPQPVVRGLDAQRGRNHHFGQQFAGRLSTVARFDAQNLQREKAWKSE